MFLIVSGGSGSGKSEYAEKMAVDLFNKSKSKKLIYIATMIPFGNESLQKIERHKNLRKGKGFTTLECFSEFKKFSENQNFLKATIILECMSNLIANEIFSDKNVNAVSDILAGILNINLNCDNLVLVTNDVFSDGKIYDNETMDYIEKLGKVNVELAKFANSVVEVVFGIPIFLKK